MTETWVIGIIRDYHGMLLNASNRVVESEKLLRKSRFMGARWRRDVGELIKEDKIAQREHLAKIRELREEYNYLGF